MRHPSTIERDYASAPASVPSSGPAMVYSLDTIAAAYEAIFYARRVTTANDKLAALEEYYKQLDELLAAVLRDTGLETAETAETGTERKEKGDTP